MLPLLDKIIRYDREYYLPHFKWKRLTLGVLCSSKTDSFSQSLLRKLVEESLLSETRQGNYSVSSPIIKNHSLIRLEDSFLYFTLEKDAEEFFNLFNKPALEIKKHGVYLLPSEISSKEWKTIRRKWLIIEERPHNPDLFSQLRERGLINDKKKENFSVIARRKNSSQEFVLNLPYSGIKGYFTSKEYAQCFADSFTKTKTLKSIEIIKN